MTFVVGAALGIVAITVIELAALTIAGVIRNRRAR